MVDKERGRIDAERIHIGYLCRNFRLQEKVRHRFAHIGNLFPDLFSVEEDPEARPAAVFELKSRIYPTEQDGKVHRQISQFGWWDLHEPQIQRYELFRRKNNVDLAWILVLARTQLQLRHIPELNEEVILWRDIYVVPWEAYKLVNVGKRDRRHLGFSRMYHHYTFEEFAAEKGTLYLANKLRSDLGIYFVD